MNTFLFSIGIQYKSAAFAHADHLRETVPPLYHETIADATVLQPVGQTAAWSRGLLLPGSAPCRDSPLSLMGRNAEAD